MSEFTDRANEKIYRTITFRLPVNPRQGRHKRCEVNGKLPALVIVLTVEEALGHCSKAFRRSKLWNADYQPQDTAPSLAEMMSGHLHLDDETTSMLESAIEDDAQNNMY